MSEPTCRSPLPTRLGADPEHRDARPVDEQVDHREHRRHQPAGAERGGREVVVGLGEARPLLRLPDEGADHPDAGDLLAQHAVDLVDVAPASGGTSAPSALTIDAEHDRRRPAWRTTQHDRQADVLAQGHDDADHDRDRRARSPWCSAITTSICTCCTSLVMRVISDGAPNAPTSRAEKSVTWWNRLRPQVAPEAHGDLARRTTRRRPRRPPGRGRSRA